VMATERAVIGENCGCVQIVAERYREKNED
jgi:hypothetical protein